MAEKEWTLQLSPEEYLERHPDGPNAELAKELAPEKVTEESPPEVGVPELVEEVQAECREARDEVGAEFLEARAKRRDDVKVLERRYQTLVSIERDLRRLEFRLNRPRPLLEKIAEATEILSDAIGRAVELDPGEELYEDDSHDVVTEAQDG